MLHLMQNDDVLHKPRQPRDATPETALTIREVSDLLAVPAPTLRSWERRRAMPSVTRDDHGHRRYTREDVALLQRMRDQRALGVKVSAAAAAATAAQPEVQCQRLLSAIEQLDADETTRLLDASVEAHGLGLTLDQVLLPSMREVGKRWSRGECDIAHEHLATNTVLGWLARRAAHAPAPSNTRPVVLSCGPLDQHTISLEAFALLLRQERLDCRNLGALTPPASLRHAVQQCSARAVVLVCQLAKNRTAAVTALHAVGNTGATVFYAGAAFRTAAARRKLPGYYLGGNLSQAVTHITTQLGHS